MNLDLTTAGVLPLQSADSSRGTDRAGMRAYHQRLLLSLIRRHGPLPKADIARRTGLSAQAISVIMRGLEADGLVVKQKPQRGKVGQPLVPFSLNASGAYFIGLKVGRRSGDLVLLDLTGAVVTKIHQPYNYPSPQDFINFVTQGLANLTGGLSAKQRERIAGLGIAAPFELWNWEDAVSAPHDVLAAWRDFDMLAEMTRLSPWPVILCNDATAACAAELVFGGGGAYADYVYFFVSYFVGGGVVLKGVLVTGRTGNAGALGSMPLGNGQLIQRASLSLLAAALEKDGRDPSVLWRNPGDWGEIGPALGRWIAGAAEALAQAAAAAASVIDFSAAIIDGAFPASVRDELVARTRDAFERLDRRGLSPLAVTAGTLGSDARAMGAASLPLLANFSTDRDLLFKGTV